MLTGDRVLSLVFASRQLGFIVMHAHWTCRPLTPFFSTPHRKLKNEAAESMLPEFDLAEKVGRKIALQKDRRAALS